LRARYLPALAEGERVAAFAATEAAAGSDHTAVRTAGVLSGEGLELSGEKSYVTNGGFAGLFTVLARTPGLGGTRAFSLVVVPREAPGVEVGPEEVKLGIRGSSTVTVRFEGVYVPMENVLGELGRGMDQAHRCLAWGRTLLSAGCVGTATAALDASRSHVLTRR
jgi:alkylation response protein AidB-like acyl-CoA dehydrogenase